MRTVCQEETEKNLLEDKKARQKHNHDTIIPIDGRHVSTIYVRVLGTAVREFANHVTNLNEKRIR